MTRSDRQNAARGAAAPGALRVVQAARADDLAVDLAAQLDALRPGPFDRCVVAVQGPGMGRWLRAFMAERAGAWGGVETPFLRGLLLGMACEAQGIAAPRGREDVAALRCSVASAMSAALQDASHGSHAVLRAMLVDAAGRTDLARLLAVSHTLAEAFDRYEVDRPELIDAWQRGTRGGTSDWSERLVALEAWQRPLWIAAARDRPARRAWQALHALVRSLEAGAVPEGLRAPAFLSVFGVSSLPPLLVRALQALARHLPVTLHLLAPSASFIAERVDRRRLLWTAAEQGLDEATMRRAHAMPAGHPLLDALGRQAVEAQRVLLDAGLDLSQVDEAATSPAGQAPSLLARLQRGLLDDEPPVPQPLDASDRSIRVHAVPTPRRAAEVVHDAVLEAFAALPGLRPEQVAILTPDLAGLGRAIESVFVERGALPLTVSDPALARPSSLVVAMERAFAAAIDGLPIDGVLDVLGMACVQQALGLDEREGPACLERLRQAGARRFADAAQRSEALGREVTDDDRLHTLQWAVDRVVLGTALGDPQREAADRAEAFAEAGEAFDAGVAAASSAGSAGLAPLHRVVQAAERLTAFAHALRGARSIEAWCAEAHALLEALLPSSEHAEFGEERVRIDRAVEALAEAARAGGFALPIDGTVARDLLLQALADVNEGTRFASGGITLARLAPMRSIPFRVLVLAGLEPGAFPRAAMSAGIDMVAAAPRAGDRSARLEDQQLFLECLHAARERLVIVHRGVEPRNVKPRPPSPVVDQLVEACAAHAGETIAQVRARIVRRHVLRADAPEAWARHDEAGFDAQARTHAQAAIVGRSAPTRAPFLAGGPIPPLPPPSLQAWRRMLTHPGEAFLERLGIRVPDPARRLAESDERIELDPLERWLLMDGCLRAMLRGTSSEAWQRWARLEGLLPHGTRGARIAADVASEARGAREKVGEIVRGQGWGGEAWRTEPFDARLLVHGMAYAVPAERVRGAPACVVRTGRSSRAESYRRWIDHVLWSAAMPGAFLILVQPNGRAVMRDPLDHAVAVRRLERLHDIATAGASRPLPIDPDVIGSWRPDPAVRADAVQAVLTSDFAKRPGLMQRPETALAHRDERWSDEGPWVQVHPDRAPVHVSLDALAAEMLAAMRQDGWLKPEEGE